ncbi:hypothetical protein chiPu_0013498 [Chiloscyllium punctatum]|uniref:Uncharacterized protein n=1 Tax=Chiloscyllium punctatum TaxID=137246 RepID=A0A401SX88_CHIPU|nr:hypothetical protein [Chiloscyllium punctatum]
MEQRLSASRWQSRPSLELKNKFSRLVNKSGPANIATLGEITCCRVLKAARGLSSSSGIFERRLLASRP